MGTKFVTVYDRFLGKITDDMYMELTPEDTLRDLQNLLIDALPGFEFPRKNLYDFNRDVDVVPESTVTEDDYVIGLIWDELVDGEEPVQMALVEKSEFGVELTAEEIEILAILMMGGWLQRQVTSIENTRMKYSGTDFKMTSQANHLSKLQSLLSECQRQSHHMQRLYKRRALQGNGLYRSTWDWFGKHGTTNIH